VTNATVVNCYEIPDAVFVGEDNKSYDFGAVIRAAPEDYALCWSHDVRRSGFLVQAGAWRLTGPEVGDFACTLGLRCALAVKGRLAKTSHVLLIEPSSLWRELVGAHGARRRY
jgi:hypothetical protein